MIAFTSVLAWSVPFATHALLHASSVSAQLIAHCETS
jgi:hypothetical protein